MSLREVAKDAPDEPAGGAVIGMHLPLMRHVKHLRAPLPQSGAETRGQFAGCAKGPVRLPPELDSFNTEDFGRGSRLRLTNPDRLFGGPSMTALLAGSEEHNPHRVSADDMAAYR